MRPNLCLRSMILCGGRLQSQDSCLYLGIRERSLVSLWLRVKEVTPPPPPDMLSEMMMNHDLVLTTLY